MGQVVASLRQAALSILPSVMSGKGFFACVSRVFIHSLCSRQRQGKGRAYEEQGGEAYHERELKSLLE